MKKLIMVAVIGLFTFGFAQMSKASTEAVRYWDYVIAMLGTVQNGGEFQGKVYESTPAGQTPDNYWFSDFNQPFDGGSIAQAVIDCKPGWYGAWAQWNNGLKDCLFYSQYMGVTYVEPGPQAMPLSMVVNPYPVLRFKVSGIPTSNDQEVWFGGNPAWFDGNTWRTTVYKPWNAMGNQMEVVWMGHGGWRVNLNPEAFNGVLSFSTKEMDPALNSPTTVKALSFLGEGAYLREDLIKYTDRYFNEEFGCIVMEFESAFNGSMGEFIMQLNGLDEASGQRVNYCTRRVEGAEGVFLVTLGNTQILPETQVKVFLSKPVSGEYCWKWVDSDLWFEATGGVKGKQ